MAKRETQFKSYSKADVAKKRVLLRVDLNVPRRDGLILDDSRIQAIIPTIQDLIKKQAKVILLSHFGRPTGNPETDKALSLNFLTPHLSELLQQDVKFHHDCIGDEAVELTRAMNPGDVILMENVRFHKGESVNNPAFTENLSALGDIYINDAFAVCHRAHASVKGISKSLPAFAGLNLKRELEALAHIADPKSKPIMGIVGGAKISTKIDVLRKLVQSCRFLALGGGIANTFLLAKGYELGNSLVEHDQIESAKSIIALAKTHNCKLILPRDARVARDLEPSSEMNVTSVKDIHPSESIFDIGPKTVQDICQDLDHAKTLIWNGPVGLFEHKPFDRSSLQIAQTAAHLTINGRLESIAGGGETLAVIKEARAKDAFSFLSTGGGAFLDYIQEKPMPGLDNLELA